MFNSNPVKYAILLLVTAPCLLATPDIAEAAQNGTKLSLVPNPSTRGTIEIVTTSLLTIIACTWSVLHLNVPGLGESTLKKTIRRLKWTLIAIIFPEIVFMNAIYDWLWARECMKVIGKLGEIEKIGAEEEFLGSNRIVTRWTIAESLDSRARRGAAWAWLRRCFRMIRAPRLASHEARTQPWTSLVSCTDGEISFDRDGNEMISIMARPNFRNLAANDHDEVRLPSNDRYFPAEQSIAYSKKSSTTGKTLVHNRNIWTLTHTYYENMGGIRIMTRGHSSDCYELYVLNGYGLGIIEFDPVYHPLKQLAITEDEIVDKSKSESFAKAIASLQFIYLVLSAISRAVRHLGLAQLEIFVLAFAVLALLTYAVYWNKPQNVNAPTVIFMPKFSDDVARDADIRESLKAQKYDPEDRILPCKEEWIIDRSRSADYANSGSDTNEKWVHSRFLVKMIQGARVDNMFSHVRAIENTFVLISGLIPFLFGGIHLLAWNFDFPTAAEHIIWRISSVVITIVPSIGIGVMAVFIYLQTREKTFLVSLIIIAGIYTIARLAIIAISFTSLREMPADVYITTWATYLPNVQ